MPGSTTLAPPSLLAASFALEPQLEPNQKSTTVESLDSSAPKPTQSTGSKGESALPMMMSHAIPAIVAIALIRITTETNADISGIFGAGCGSCRCEAAATSAVSAEMVAASMRGAWSCGSGDGRAAAC